MDFLVKLSRNPKIMVPIVAIVGMSIFGGGYVVRDRSISSARQAEQAQTQTQSQNNTNEDQQTPSVDTTEQPISEEPSAADVEPTTTESPDTSVSSDQSSNGVTILPTFEDGTLTVEISSDVSGKCTTEINGQKLEAKSEEGQCVFTDVETGEAKTITVTFESDDHAQSAVETISL